MSWNASTVRFMPGSWCCVKLYPATTTSKKRSHCTPPICKHPSQTDRTCIFGEHPHTNFDVVMRWAFVRRHFPRNPNLSRRSERKKYQPPLCYMRTAKTRSKLFSIYTMTSRRFHYIGATKTRYRTRRVLRGLAHRCTDYLACGTITENTEAALPAHFHSKHVISLFHQR